MKQSPWWRPEAEFVRDLWRMLWMKIAIKLCPDAFRLEKEIRHLKEELETNRLRQEIFSAQYATIKTELCASQQLRRALEIENAKLLDHAWRDPLTKLLNRNGFENALHRQVGTIQRYIDLQGGVFYPPYLAYIDLDEFKKVNDAYGHEEGDKILLVVTAILKKFCHRDTNPVCRQGGDEFLILFTSSTEEQVLVLVESIRTSIEKDVVLRKHAVTASIGVARINIDQHSRPADMDAAYLDAAYQEGSTHADRAMYHSKRIGRNVVTVTDGKKFLSL